MANPADQVLPGAPSQIVPRYRNEDYQTQSANIQPNQQSALPIYPRNPYGLRSSTSQGDYDLGRGRPPPFASSLWTVGSASTYPDGYTQAYQGSFPQQSVSSRVNESFPLSTATLSRPRYIPQRPGQSAQNGTNGTLDSRFKIPRKPAKFFKTGKVFLILWSEPAGERTEGSTASSISSQNSYGEPVFSKIRRCVVVREGKSSCVALPIATYGRQGVTKPGIVKSDHAIIYSTKQEPRESPGEAPCRGQAGMLPFAIRVVPDEKDAQLDTMSRLDFGTMFTIEYNVKVRSFGMVHEQSKAHLVFQFLQTLQNSIAKTAGMNASLKRNGLGELGQHGDVRACASVVASYFRKNEHWQEADELEDRVSRLLETGKRKSDKGDVGQDTSDDEEEVDEDEEASEDKG